MFAEEETELRDMIIHNLENCGFLNKIKAELRAGVFLAIEEDGNLKNKIPLFNKKFDEFAATTEGKLMLSLVRDFLEFFNLQFTLSVFDPEIAIDSPCLSRTEICNQLKLKSDIEGPIISELIKEKLHKHDRRSAENFVTDFHLGDGEMPNTVPECVLSQNSNEFNAYNKTDLINSKTSGKQAKSTEDDKKELKHNTKILQTLTEENYFDKTTNTKNMSKSIFKEANDLSADHDPFFDEPLPSEKTSLFSFTETLKEKPDGKFVVETQNTVDKTAKSGLSSLKDLPSLTNNEWTFSTDIKQTFPSLESQKSVSSSEASNEEIINLDIKDSFQKKDSDVVESNDSSEKPNSEESIEEDIEEEFSAGFDDLLNSSLSLADDVTTDQTVSQTSIIEGVDHVEPCK